MLHKNKLYVPTEAGELLIVFLPPKTLDSPLPASAGSGSLVLFVEVDIGSWICPVLRPHATGGPLKGVSVD